MELLKTLLPVAAILVVLVTMAAVDVVIIGEPLRVVSIIPMCLVLLLWGLATTKTGGENSVR